VQGTWSNIVHSLEAPPSLGVLLQHCDVPLWPLFCEPASDANCGEDKWVKKEKNQLTGMMRTGASVAAAEKEQEKIVDEDEDMRRRMRMRRMRRMRKRRMRMRRMRMRMRRRMRRMRRLDARREGGGGRKDRRGKERGESIRRKGEMILPSRARLFPLNQ
jgi:hypothetical protein